MTINSADSRTLHITANNCSIKAISPDNCGHCTKACKIISLFCLHLAHAGKSVRLCLNSFYRSGKKPKGSTAKPGTSGNYPDTLVQKFSKTTYFHRSQEIIWQTLLTCYRNPQRNLCSRYYPPERAAALPDETQVADIPV